MTRAERRVQWARQRVESLKTPGISSGAFLHETIAALHFILDALDSMTAAKAPARPLYPYDGMLRAAEARWRADD